MVTIVNFGMGNLGSIHNMLTRLGFDVKITSDINEIKNAEKLILPGVGAFDQAMANLHNQELVPILNYLVLEKRIPILGICLGMQLLAQRSEEGKLEGLGWIDAEVIRFRFDPAQNLRIPHIGWNTLTVKQESCLFKKVYEESRFYFVHSYYVNCNSEDTVLTTTNYGFDFTSAVMQGNIYGVQFHPEKSHKFGMLLLKNFAEFC
jgi:glutamine amidotransferase